MDAESKPDSLARLRLDVTSARILVWVASVGRDVELTGEADLYFFDRYVVLGLVFSATPGPVFAETVRQGVRGGFRSALAVQLGSLVGDALWAIVGLVSVGFLSRVEALQTPISVAGVAYLLWLACGAWQSSRREVSASLSAETTHRRAFQSGVLLSLTNPQNIAFWAAIGSALRAIGVTEPTVADNLAFFAAFMVSSTVWAFFVAASVDRVFRGVGLAWARMTYRACAVALLVLALAMLRQLWFSRHELDIQTPNQFQASPNQALHSTAGCVNR